MAFLTRQFDIRASGLGFQSRGLNAAAEKGRSTNRCQFLYDRALENCRSKNYAGARRAFQTCVAVDPDFSKAWVSWAQMEKRADEPGESDKIERCRRVLQRGLSLNPTDAKLLQAWGLMELQRGNILAAVLLLERCVQLDSRCRPVLQWRIVQVAKQTVGSRIRRQLQPVRITAQNDEDSSVALR